MVTQISSPTGNVLFPNMGILTGLQVLLIFIFIYNLICNFFKS
jgi:hypothetical protein